MPDRTIPKLPGLLASRLLNRRKDVDLPSTPRAEKERQLIVVDSKSAPAMPKERQILGLFATKRKASELTTDPSAPPAKKPFFNRLVHISLSSKRTRKVVNGLPTPSSNITSHKIDGLPPAPRPRVTQKELQLPPTHFAELPPDPPILPASRHILSPEYQLVECMNLRIDNEEFSGLPTFFTMETKGEKDRNGLGDVIHFKLHAQPYGGCFTEATLMVELVDPDTKEIIPIVSFFPDHEPVDIVRVEHEKTRGWDIGLVVGAAAAYIAGTVKWMMRNVWRYTTEEPSAVISGIRLTKNSIRWHARAGQINSQGLSKPLYIQLSIQMTKDVMARLRLYCTFKPERDGTFIKRILPGKTLHGLPDPSARQGSGDSESESVEIMLVRMTGTYWQEWGYVTVCCCCVAFIALFLSVYPRT